MYRSQLNLHRIKALCPQVPAKIVVGSETSATSKAPVSSDILFVLTKRRRRVTQLLTGGVTNAGSPES